MPLGMLGNLAPGTLRFGYHLVPIKEVDKYKITFWGIDEHVKDWFY
jgi:hypothetical protein